MDDRQHCANEKRHLQYYTGREENGKKLKK